MNLDTVLQARDLLLDETPLARDCGTLCGGACCQGDDAAGMLLFPGEETLYTECAFGRTQTLSYSLGGRPAVLFICEGNCTRGDRPLACRLFPLFLRFRQGTPRVEPDPRAGICPLRRYGLAGLRQSFVKTVEDAYHLLLTDPDCAAFLRDLDSTLSLQAYS